MTDTAAQTDAVEAAAAPPAAAVETPTSDYLSALFGIPLKTKADVERYRQAAKDIGISRKTLYATTQRDIERLRRRVFALRDAEEGDLFGRLGR